MERLSAASMIRPSTTDHRRLTTDDRSLIPSIVGGRSSVVLCARGPSGKQGDPQPFEQRVGPGRCSRWLLCGLGFANELSQARGVQLLVVTFASDLGIY